MVTRVLRKRKSACMFSIPIFLSRFPAMSEEDFGARAARLICKSHRVKEIEATKLMERATPSEVAPEAVITITTTANYIPGPPSSYMKNRSPTSDNGRKRRQAIT